MSESHDNIATQLNDYQVAQQLKNTINPLVEWLNSNDAKAFDEMYQTSLDKNKNLSVMNKEFLRLLILINQACSKTIDEDLLTSCIRIVIDYSKYTSLMSQLPKPILFMLSAWQGELKHALWAFSKMSEDDKKTLFSNSKLLECIISADGTYLDEGKYLVYDLINLKSEAETNHSIKLLLTFNHFTKTGNHETSQAMFNEFFNQQDIQICCKPGNVSKFIYILFMRAVEYGNLDACKKLEELFTTQRLPSIMDKFSNPFLHGYDAFDMALFCQPENNQLLDWLWQRIPAEQQKTVGFKHYFKIRRSNYFKIDVFPVEMIDWVLSKCDDKQALIDFIRHENYFASAINRYGIEAGFWLLKNNIVIAGKETFVAMFKNVEDADSEQGIELIKYIVETADPSQMQLINECLDMCFNTAMNRSSNLARLCINLGLDVDMRVSDDVNSLSDSPLVKACDHGNVEIASLLLEKGADPNCMAWYDWGCERPLLLHCLLVDEDCIVDDPDIGEIEILLVMSGASIETVRDYIGEDEKITDILGDYLYACCDLLEEIREQHYQIGRVACVMNQNPGNDEKGYINNIFSVLPSYLQKLICLQLVCDHVSKASFDSIFAKRIEFMGEFYKNRGSEDKPKDQGKSDNTNKRGRNGSDVSDQESESEQSDSSISETKKSKLDETSNHNNFSN